MDSTHGRRAIKGLLATCSSRRAAGGVTILIYHRVGGGSTAELDCPATAFSDQLDILAGHDVVSLDIALARLDAGDSRPSVVLTFDDGFADVHRTAWPLLRERGLPFTLYLATAYLGGDMVWEGASPSSKAPGLAWEQVGEMADSGLCTLGNHTHTHVPPDRLSVAELDRCNQVLLDQTGRSAHHFAYPWGVRVPALEPELRRRFRSAVTGSVGRNLPGADPIALRRVPVRRTDPNSFFRAKLAGNLVPERLYGRLVQGAKRAGAHA